MCVGAQSTKLFAPNKLSAKRKSSGFQNMKSLIFYGLKISTPFFLWQKYAEPVCHLQIYFSCCCLFRYMFSVISNSRRFRTKNGEHSTTYSDGMFTKAWAKKKLFGMIERLSAPHFLIYVFSSFRHSTWDSPGLSPNIFKPVGLYVHVSFSLKWADVKFNFHCCGICHGSVFNFNLHWWCWWRLPVVVHIRASKTVENYAVAFLSWILNLYNGKWMASSCALVYS